MFPRSSVLVLGPNSIQSLVPSTIISQLESLLESHRLDDSYQLADQRRKKLEESLEPDEDEVSATSLCLATPHSQLHSSFSGRGASIRLPADWFSMFCRNIVRRCWKTPFQRRARPTNAHQLLPGPQRKPILSRRHYGRVCWRCGPHAHGRFR